MVLIENERKLYFFRYHCIDFPDLELINLYYKLSGGFMLCILERKFEKDQKAFEKLLKLVFLIYTL